MGPAVPQPALAPALAGGLRGTREEPANSHARLDLALTVCLDGAGQLDQVHARTVAPVLAGSRHVSEGRARGETA